LAISLSAHYPIDSPVACATCWQCSAAAASPRTAAATGAGCPVTQPSAGETTAAPEPTAAPRATAATPTASAHVPGHRQVRLCRDRVSPTGDLKYRGVRAAEG
jgi:hypothetical protein